MKIFTINKQLSVVCGWKKNRSGFKHEATLLRNGDDRLSVKCQYYNRTWESYEYESVLSKLLEKSADVLSESESKRFAAKIKNGWKP